MKDKLRRFHKKKRNEVHWPPSALIFGCYSKNIPQCNESIYDVYGLFLSAGNGISVLIVNVKWECAFLHLEKRIIYLWFLPLWGAK